MLRHVYTLAIAIFATLALIATSGQAAQPETGAAQRAIDYILTLQNSDGGFPAFGAESSPGSTLDAAFAFVAFGIDPVAVTADGNGPDGYLETQAASYSTDPGAAAKLALGVSLMGLDPADFAGVDLLSVMDGAVDGATGAYGLDTFDEVFYLLALAAMVEPMPEAVVEHLRSLQNGDGGWPFFAGGDSDGNTTAIVLQALIGAGVPATDQTVRDGLDYLAATQNNDGGFGFLPGEETDPNSTAFAVQALVSADEDIGAGGPWAPGGDTPLGALLSFQNPATGAFQFFGEDSAFATYQAVPALMLAPFPHLDPRPGPEAPAPMPTPAASPAVTEPAPAATATPAPASIVAPQALPAAGSGGGDASSGIWIAIAGLVTGGAVIGGAIAAWRRLA